MAIAKSDNEMYDSVHNKTNILQELYVIKIYVLKHVACFEPNIALYVKIRSRPVILFDNKFHIIVEQKLKYFFL